MSLMSETAIQIGDRVLFTRQVPGAKKGAQGIVTALYGERGCIAEIRITNHNLPGRAGAITVHTAITNLHRLTAPTHRN